MLKKTYVAPALKIHGTIDTLTLGSRLAFEDAWFGASGTDGIAGRTCRPGDSSLWYSACGS